MKEYFGTKFDFRSLTTLLGQAPVALSFMRGKDHIITYANEEALKLWGRDERIIGIPVIEAMPEIADQEFPAILKSVYETGLPVKANDYKTLVQRYGAMETRYFNFIFTPVYEDDLITGVSTVAIDTTEQVLNAIRLQESEIRFKELIELSDYSTAIYRGEDLIITFANDQMIKSWGKDRSVIGQPLDLALPELEGQPFVQILKNIFISGKPYIATEDLVSLVVDGKRQNFYYNFSYRPLRNKNGEIYAILNVAMNVTDHVNARKEALRIAHEYRELAEAMPQIICTIHNSGKIEYSNDNLLKFFNIERDELAQITIEKILHPDDFRLCIAKWRRASQDKCIFEMENRFLSPLTNDYVWFLNRATPILDENGEILHWICTSTDINEFKISAKKKDTFLGIASHELKTPLTSLKLYAQVLERALRKAGDEKNAEFAHKMDQQLLKLTSLIEDFLDVTKINTGKIALKEAEFDFETLVAETVDEQRLTTFHKIELSSGAVGTVFADQERISQVIINLLSNAIKYSPNGEKVLVKVSADERNVKLAVTDFGIGMPADKKDKVFEQYYRVSSDAQSTFPGLGLGLYISSQIVERSHGKIWVDSVLGEGSTFYFTLPKA